MAKIKKIALIKNTRRLAVAAAALVWAVSVYFLVMAYRTPPFVEQAVPVLTYHQKGDLSYLVRLKPNSIYPNPVLGPGSTYFNKLVENLNITLAYQFLADKPASMLTGAYEIIATIDAPDFWQKRFTIIPYTEMTTEGNSLTLNRTLPLDLGYFNEVLKQTNEEVGVSAQDSKLIVAGNIYLNAVTSEGKIKETMSPTISIPLTTGSFKIGGEPSIQRDGSLTQVVQVENQALSSRKKLTTGVSSGLLLLLLLFLFFTEGKVLVIDSDKMKIDSVMKKYGERIVLVNSDVLYGENENVIPVNSMEDLVRLADELGKPILFSKPGGEEMPTYYVLDGPTAFIFQLA